MTLATICLGLIAAAPATDPASLPGVAKTYEEARAKAGRSPDEQVKLALWCEAHGLTTQRLHHLTLAVLADPKNAAARGLMGLVSYNGRWLRPEVLAERLKADTSLAEYEAKRLKAPYTAEGQWALGIWCEEHGLKDQAKAHLTAVTRLDPTREAAWKRLGFKRHEGRWVTDAQLAAEKAEAQAQAQADRTWRPLLEKWRGWLGKPDRKAEAVSALDGLTDFRAVPSIWRVFAVGGTGDQALAVRLLGQVDAPVSSQALALLVVSGKSSEVRRSAAEILALRDPREYVGFLIGLIRDPIRYQTGLAQDPSDGTMHRTLLVEGKKYNVATFFDRAIGYFPPPRLYADCVPFDPYGRQAALAYQAGIIGDNPVTAQALLGALHGAAPTHAQHASSPAPVASPGVNLNAQIMNYTIAASLRDVQIAAVLAQGPVDSPRFQMTVADLDAWNASIQARNARVYDVLTMTTDQNLPQDREAWKSWWVNALGFTYKYRSSQSTQTQTAQPKPTFYQAVQSCFAAGTPVRTLTGVRPIESLQVGDQVLTLDTATGSLGYRSIVVVHHNQPAATLRVTVGDETIVATGLHRFWKPGKGWVMARDLKPDDMVRTLEGPSRVASVEPAPIQAVFNLDVAEYRTFFVGRSNTLVHDNTLPELRLAPFDAAPTPAAVARQAD